MTDPIEAVARALCKALYPHADIEQPAMRWDHVDGVMMPTDQPMWTDHVDDARAAIAAFLDAVREPADTIISKGADEYWIARLQPKFPGDEHMARGAWRSMIDALRAELLPPPGDGG